MGISGGGAKTAGEVFKVDPKALRDKDELTKEEKRKERANRKRKISSHLKHKEIARKERNREQGIA